MGVLNYGGNPSVVGHGYIVLSELRFVTIIATGSRVICSMKIGLMQGSTNCSILRSQMGDHGVIWENTENTENMEKMENFN